MGSKGLQTRARLIDATVELLETVRLRDLTVAQVARKAATATATFYLYFREITDVVLAALVERAQSPSELVALLEQQWEGDAAWACARRVVEGYVAFWDANRTLFRIRNLAAEEGDMRFNEARVLVTRPFTAALTRRVEACLAAGLLPDAIDPPAMAGTLTALLERLGAISELYRERGDGGLYHASMLDSAALVLTTMLGGGARDIRIAR